MRRHSSLYALALIAVVTAACDSGAKKSGSGSDPYTGDSATLYDVAVVKPTGGFVTSSIGGIDCGFTPAVDKSRCDAIGLDRATPMILTATAAEGYRFREWAGECSGTAASCTLTPSTGTTWYRIVAVFETLDGRTAPTATGPIGRVYGLVSSFDTTPMAAATSISKAASGSTVTVSLTNHGLSVGWPIKVTVTGADLSPTGKFASSTSRGFTVAKVVDANTFTYSDGVSVSASATGTPTNFVMNAPIFLAGIKVSLLQGGVVKGTATTASQGVGSASGGRYAIDAAPGTYQVTVADTASPAGHTFAAQTDVTVADATASSCTVNPNMEIEEGSGVAGCLVRKDVSGATRTAYGVPFVVTTTITSASAINVSPSAPATPSVAAASATAYQVGLNSDVTFGCSASTSTFGSQEAISWSQTAGPTYVDTAGWTATQTFRTPKLSELVAITAAADSAQQVVYGTKVVSCPKYDDHYQGTQGAGSQVTKVGCGVSELYLPNRAGFLTIGRQMFTELAYTFRCNVTRTAVETDLTSMAKDAAGLVTVDTVNAHGLKAGDKVTVTISSAADAASFAGGTFSVASTPTANQFTYNDRKTIAAAATLTGAVKLATSQSASAQIFPLNIVNGSMSNFVQAQLAPANPKVMDGGGAAVPVNSIVIANSGTAGSWSITPATPLSDPNGGSITNTTNVLFKVGMAGTYTVTVGTTSMSVTAKQYYGGGACQSCHSGRDPAIVAEWAGSQHSRINYNAMSGTNYSTTCLACHTQGYDPTFGGATNFNTGGWIELAKTAGPGGGQYNLPDFMFLNDASGNFGPDTFPATLKARSGISCENCHGPVDGHMAAGSPGAPVVSYEATDCLWCHDGGHHNIYNQWRSEGHSNLATAQAEGTRQACRSCHSAQGFIAVWSKLVLQTGDPAQAAAATEAMAKGSPIDNVTTANVSPITCQVCHEPHKAEVRIGKADAEKRITLGYPSTYAQYSVPSTDPAYALGNTSTQDAIQLDGTEGNGALCMACHNSRRAYGRRQSGVENPLQAWNTPHDGPQADVYLNLGTFWFGTTPPVLNVHGWTGGWIQDSCASCHVKVIPANYPTVANHTFDANHACEVCHGSGLLPDGTSAKGKAFIQGTEAQIQAIAERIVEKLNAFNAVTPIKAGGYDMTGRSFARCQIYDGSIWLFIDEASAPIKTNIDGIVRVSDGTKLVVYNATGDGANINYAKALYNVATVQRDKSGGIHNMQGVRALLQASFEALGNIQ